MPTGLGVGLEYIKYTVKINMLYLIQKKKKCGNRLQAVLLITFEKLELSNN